LARGWRAAWGARVARVAVEQLLVERRLGHHHVAAGDAVDGACERRRLAARDGAGKAGEHRVVLPRRGQHRRRRSELQLISISCAELQALLHLGGLGGRAAPVVEHAAASLQRGQVACCVGRREATEPRCMASS